MNTADRIRIQRRFASALAHIGYMAVWYSESRCRIFVRSHPFDAGKIHTNRQGQPAIPLDAIRVGDYAAPFTASEFLDDLDEAIRRANLLAG